MPDACNLIRQEPHYRRDAFDAGLKACGYAVRRDPPAVIRADDVLLIWNRYNHHDLATRFEQAGGTVLVAENGYLGAGGMSPHSMAERDPYALARGWHNDAAAITRGDADRWGDLGIALKPWRESGGHVLVCSNRPFGAPGRAMPADWAHDVRHRLQKLTRREIRVRAHPGNVAPARPLAADLEGAWGVVIWSSSAGVHALVAGIPVICEAPYWICKDATSPDWQSFHEASTTDRRLESLRRLAWGQWKTREIASGLAFRAVMGYA